MNENSLWILRETVISIHEVFVSRRSNRNAAHSMIKLVEDFHYGNILLFCEIKHPNIQSMIFTLKSITNIECVTNTMHIIVSNVDTDFAHWRHIYIAFQKVALA